MITSSMLWLLQANDSAYPSGAYAHSFGLEGAVQAGAVRDADDLGEFLRREIMPGLLSFELPWFARCHAMAAADDLDSLLLLDHELDAWKIPRELREASRSIGLRRLEMLASLHPESPGANYLALQPPGHQLAVAALEYARAPRSEAACAVVYQALAGHVSASMKLIRIGQTSCQKLLHECLALVSPDIEQALSSQPATAFNPLLEIHSLRHARADARLFIS
jgi:urease accessory protein